MLIRLTSTYSMQSLCVYKVCNASSCCAFLVVRRKPIYIWNVFSCRKAKFVITHRQRNAHWRTNTIKCTVQERERIKSINSPTYTHASSYTMTDWAKSGKLRLTEHTMLYCILVTIGDDGWFSHCIDVDFLKGVVLLLYISISASGSMCDHSGQTNYPRRAPQGQFKQSDEGFEYI